MGWVCGTWVRGESEQPEWWAGNDDDVSDLDDHELEELIGSSSKINIEFDDEHPVFETPGNTSGDVLMHNNAFLWWDLLQYWEMWCSIKDGDVGQTFEVIKVHDQVMDCAKGWPCIQYEQW